MRMLLQLGACFALGLFVALLILAGLMFAQRSTLSSSPASPWRTSRWWCCRKASGSA